MMRFVLLPLLIALPFSMLSAQDGAVPALKAWLAKPRADRPPLAEQDFAKQAIDKAQAAEAVKMLWADHLAMLKKTRAEEVAKKRVTVCDKTMPYLVKTFGEKPKDGRSLYISMHGGGGAPPRVNDQQWQNQIRLYQPEEGIYLAPRAPTNTWNLWHQGHIDPLFDRLIENLIAFEDVNPEKVYLMGYSAGGDGVYQLAPRMSDRFAAAAMMAGHPNETQPIGLRNLPFALQVGERDTPYKRNEIAGQWQKKLADLRKADPDGYEHFVKIHKGRGHWMNLDDKIAVPWMAKFKRSRFPDKVVWKQDDVTHPRFYWLALPEDQIKARQLIVASRKDQVIRIEQAEGVAKLTVLLNDEMLDLDKAVGIASGEKKLFAGKAERTIATIARTLAERGDPGLVFSASVTVDLE